jgi:diacylglycerol O-acyltransferase
MTVPGAPGAAGRPGWPGPRQHAQRRPARAQEGSRLPHGLAQIGIALLTFAVYLAVARLPHAGLSTANLHGDELLRAERWLGIDIELAANRWLAGHSFLAEVAAWEYAITYIVTTFAVLGLIWWRRPAEYAWARNTLLLTTLIAITCFAAWPATPPRLLPGSGFTDIVALFHPFLSWGSGAVSAGANQFAAMPSLHVGWAVWVTAVTIRARAGRIGYGLALLHLAVTVVVIVATGNHYLLDVAGGAAIVGLAIGAEKARSAVATRISRSRRSERVAAPDEFFLYVESPTAQQPVGGFVMLDFSQLAVPPSLADIRRLVAERIDRMPRFRQRLVPASRWRHTRWQPAEVDIDWHVREHRLQAGSGRAGLADFVGQLAEQQLDRDRPLWQVWLVPNVGPAEGSVVAILHHAVADGLGVVDTLRQLFDPKLPEPDLSGIRQPPWPVRAAASVAGLTQLAADGTADQLPIVQPLTGQRRYRFASTPLEPVRELARSAGSRVTDVLLAAVGQAVTELLAARGLASDGRWLRAAVPQTTRLPAPAGTGRRAEAGNRTSALRLDVPLGDMPPLERLRRTAAGARARRRSGRALAAAMVMRGLGILPPRLHSWAARAVYNGRYLTSIISNMPGPSVTLSMAGAPIRDTYPILPLADRVPLAVGTLGWSGRFCLSVITDPAVFPEAGALAARTVEVIEQMQQDAWQAPGGPRTAATRPDRAAADGEAAGGGERAGAAGRVRAIGTGGG